MVPLALLGGPVGALLLKALDSYAGVPIELAFSWPWLVMLLLVSPVVEELAFREFVQGSVSRVLSRHPVLAIHPAVGANLVASAMFSLCHLAAQSTAVALLIFIPSLLLGAMREACDSIWPCMVTHAWFNACFLVVFLLWQD